MLPLIEHFMTVWRSDKEPGVVCGMSLFSERYFRQLYGVIAMSVAIGAALVWADLCYNGWNLLTYLNIVVWFGWIPGMLVALIIRGRGRPAVVLDMKFLGFQQGMRNPEIARGRIYSVEETSRVIRIIGTEGRRLKRFSKKTYDDLEFL
ncbi:MAG: hypothetical protein PF961_21855, partial [Planctomycetota bacterium]|nr:hypothetical protein [Planctomycetota bacterium]